MTTKYLKLAIRIWWRQPKWGTIAFLMLGFVAMNLSFSLRRSSDLFVTQQARNILTSDLQISSSREISQDEIQLIQKSLSPSQTSLDVELMATLRHQDKTQLLELKAVDENFPLVGHLTLNTLGKTRAGTLTKGHIWLAAELQPDLGLKVGDQVGLGETTFTIADWITADVGVSRGASGLLPRAYIRLDDLNGTGLIQPGSQAQRRINLVRADQFLGVRPEMEVQPWPDNLIARTPQDSVQGIERGLHFFRQYMGFGTLLLALLAFVSAFYLIQIKVGELTSGMAILLLVGGSSRLTQLFLSALLMLDFLFSWLLAAASSWTLGEVINSRLFFSLPMNMHWTTDIQVFSISALLAFSVWVMCALPFLFRLWLLEPVSLLEASHLNLPALGGLKGLIPYLTALMGFVVMASYTLSSLPITATFFLLLLSFLAFSSLGLPWVAGKLGRMGLIQKHPARRLGLLHLTRVRLSNVLLSLVLLWASLTISLISNLLAMAEHELSAPRPSELPQIFTINIQEEDLSPLESWTRLQQGELRHLSPLVLGRLTRVNNEQPRNPRLAKFPVRLSYREGLADSESIIQGDPLPKNWRWSADQQSPIPISLEVEFAQRNEIQLNDVLEFNVMGDRFNGRVTNLRRVNWKSFQPNFFIQFPPGIFNDYPKSWIGVIYGLAGSRLFETQTALAKAFPNLTLINLSQTIQRLAELSQKLIDPLVILSVIGLITTLAVTYFLALMQISYRSPEIHLYQLLGANHAQIKSIYLVEVATLMLLSIFPGLLMGNIASLWISLELFEQWPRHLTWSTQSLATSLMIIPGLFMVWFLTHRKL